jgi:hypothetical protein
MASLWQKDDWLAWTSVEEPKAWRKKEAQIEIWGIAGVLLVERKLRRVVREQQ